MIKYILAIFLAFLPLSSKAEVSFQNLTILVSSCDKYAEVWQPFFTFFFRHWPSLKTHNAHVPVVLITNEKSFGDPRVRVFQTGPDKSWSDNLLAVLKETKTDYVLYLQEDYFFTRPVDETRLQEILVAMDKEGAGHVTTNEDRAFINDTRHSTLHDVTIVNRFADEFRTSLQSGIWRKDVLMWLIKPGESPWAFEKTGSIRSQGLREPFWAVTDRHPLCFLNACHGGYWKIEALHYMKKAGIEIPHRLLPLKEENRFRRFFQRNFPRLYNKWVRP